MSKEAMKLALAVLECLKRDFDADQFEWGIADEAITALRKALANEALDKMAENAKELGLNYAPAQRTWVGLTDEEISSLWDGHTVPVFGKTGINPIVFARAIEAKLKEKNT